MFISAIGVSNLVIVQTTDALLVANKDTVQDVKKIVDYLKRNDRNEYKQHQEVFRPWENIMLLIAEKITSLDVSLLSRVRNLWRRCITTGLSIG